MSTAIGNRLDIVVPRLQIRDFHRTLTEAEWRDFVLSDIQPDRSKYHGMHRVQIRLVSRKSPVTMRRATETLARYFQREFGYDFLQYSEDERGDSRDRVYLWTRDDCMFHSAVGAACFRWRDYSNAPHGLALAWIWLHPYLRRQGILSAHWEYFRARHGDFYVETPLSPAMEAFLKVRGECARCGRICRPENHGDEVARAEGGCQP
jgi:hypothetical protein